MDAKSLAVFLPNWIGDVVMATPVLRALRRRYPQATITGVMRPYVADVLAGNPWLDENLLYHPKSDKKELRSWSLVRNLRERALDLAVLLPNSLRTAVLATFGGAKQRVGYVRYGRSLFLTGKLAPPREPDGRLARTPMADYYLRIAEAAGCPGESPRLELFTTPEDERQADSVWRNMGLRSDVVVINSSGAFGAAKLWPPLYSAALAKRIAMFLDHDVLIICGPSERDAARQIVQAAEHPRVMSLADVPASLGLSKACVRRARLMITTDSGPRHFAAAFGVPLVSLFGPTPPVWGNNPTVKETQLMVADLDCLGCHKRECPWGHHRCMLELRPDRVFDAAVNALRTSHARAA